MPDAQILATDKEIYFCHDCKFLESMPEGPYWIHSINTGMSLNFGTGSMPIFADMILCPTHAAQRP